MFRNIFLQIKELALQQIACLKSISMEKFFEKHEQNRTEIVNWSLPVNWLANKSLFAREQKILNTKKTEEFSAIFYMKNYPSPSDQAFGYIKT